MTQPLFVTESRVEDMRAALAKLQRRAARHGLVEPLYRVGPIGQYHEHSYRDALDRLRVWHEVRFPVWIDEGDPIKVAGWQFIARLERLGDGVLVHVVPGAEAVFEERWRSPKTQGRCDHCRVDRQRKDTYVVRSEETGEQRQIGSTCLRDFLGCDTPASIAKRFEIVGAMRDGVDTSDGGGWGEYDALTITVLATTSTLMRLRGWLSKSRAREDEVPTASLVHTVLFGTGEEAGKLRAEVRRAHTDADEERARAALAHWTGLVGGTEYERNLTLLLGRELTLARHLGLVCSGLASWARTRGEELYPKKETPVSRALGTAGQRLRDLPMTIADVRYMGEGYGGADRLLIKMRAEDGAQACWFTASAPGLDAGVRVLVTGTVKKVAEFRGVLETQLTRCRVEVLQEADAR